MERNKTILNGLNTCKIPQFKQALKTYFVAKAINETNIKIDTEAKTKVLKGTPFYYSGDAICQKQGERLLNPSLDYNLTDTDFIKYIKLVHFKRVQMGLKLPYHKFKWAKKEPWNLAADAESRPILKSAEDVLIYAGIEILPKPLKTDYQQRYKTILANYTMRQKMLNLITRLDVGDLGTTQEIIKGVTL